MKFIKIISASQYSKDHLPQPLLQQSCGVFYDRIPAFTSNIIYSNTESLAKVYNHYLTEEYKNSILIFCHDDLIIEDLFLQKKLNAAMELFDIVGLAGIQAPIQIKHPCLWHLMGSREQYSGAVAHFETNSDVNRFMTSFGPTPKRCVLLDGVFLAINTNRILEKGLRFDENNPAKFHFYDLHFCLDANKLGLKLGTYPIWATHKSHGLKNMSQDWIAGEQYFLKKFQNI
jgi:hypothetical protein